MSLRARILVLAAAGFLAGLMTWPALAAVMGPAGTGLAGQAILGSVAGGGLGLGLGSVEALRGREGRRGLRRGVLALLLGLAGGAAGAALGRALFARLGGFLVQALLGHEAMGLALGLAAGWALLGATIGAAGGVAERSARRARYGAAGGSLGGFVGGLLFAALAGWHGGSAALALGCLGAATGAGIAAAEEILIALRLRVVKGPLKGREYPLVKAVTTLGRDDRCDICLSGQEGVGVAHGRIRLNGEGVTVEKTGEEGIWVNDRPIRKTSLRDGDLLRLGSALFLVSSRPGRAPETVRPRARFLRRLVARLGVGLAFVVLLGEPRAAEGGAATLRITQVDTAPFPRVHLYAAVESPAGEPVRGILPESWRLLEEGHPRVIREAAPLAALGGRRRASVILLLDKSGSMAGEKLAQAQAALREYIGVMQSGDSVALLAFDEAVHELSDFTGEPAALRRALDVVTASGNTALGDALGMAVERLEGRPGRRAVVVLSDGIQTRGRRTPEEAGAAAVQAQVSLTTIALGADARRADLKRLATATGGTFHVAPGPAALVGIYRAVAFAFRHEYRLTFESAGGGEVLRHLRLSLAHEDLAAAAERAYLRPDAGLFEGAAALPSWWGGLLSALALAGLVTLGAGGRRSPAAGPTVSLLTQRGTRTLALGPEGLTVGQAGASTLALRPSGTGVVATEASAGTVRLNHRPLGGSALLRDGDVLTVDGSTFVFEEGSGSGSDGERRPA
jgi:VWFA-related protein